MQSISTVPNPLDEIVSVTNEGTEAFEGMYQGARTVIAPGETAHMVKREACVLWFGNPAAIDHYDGTELKEDRTNECARLDARYGVFPIRRDEANTTPARTREEAWPQVKVTQVNGKETYRMVTNNPEGHDLEVKTQTKGEFKDMQDTIEALKRRLESYEAEVARGVQPDGAVQDAPTRRTKAS